MPLVRTHRVMVYVLEFKVGQNGAAAQADACITSLLGVFLMLSHSDEMSPA